MKQQKPFFISTIANHYLEEILSNEVLDLLQDSLNKNLHLSDYGSDVQRLVFIFIAVDPDTGFHEESLEYSTKRKRILVVRKLPTYQFSKASPQLMLELMAATFLSAIEQYPALKLRDFDYRRFREDVQQVFEKKEWLVAQTV